MNETVVGVGNMVGGRNIEIPKHWWTSGNIFRDRMVCQFSKPSTSHGIWYGHNPMDFPTPLCMVELILIFFINRLLYAFLYPLRQSFTVAQILSGIIIGPSFLTHDRKIANRFFPPPGKYILKNISGFGFMLHLFILGVKIDMSSVRVRACKSMIIGFSGLLFSLLFGSSAFIVVRQFTNLDQSQYAGIRILIFFNSLTFFMVTNSYIHDLRLSNSDMGRLASSSSLVIDAFGMVATLTILIGFSPTNTDYAPPAYLCLISTSFFYFVLFGIFRPLVLYILSRTPRGSTMKQTHFLLILAIVLFSWVWGENEGQRFATFFFGLSLPDGPPLGTVLVQKLEIFTSGLMLPVYCTMAGFRVDLVSLKRTTSSLWGMEFIFVFGQLGKFIGTLISSVFLGVPLEDAVPLGLMMSFKGLMEIASLNVWKDHSVLDEQLYSLSMINVALFTAVAYPLVQHMYDPSAKYNTVRKRGLMASGDNACDLQVLVCIHNEANVPTMINVLEVSKYNRVGGSISVFALQLIQLTGSSMPILVPLHKFLNSNRSLANPDQLDRTANALRQFEEHSQGCAKVQQFVSMAPYKSMHNDICTLAHEKRISFLILPYHKEWGVDGKVETTFQQIRDINRRVLRKAPCSVAILIDRGGPTGAVYCVTTSGPCIYQIVMLFIGGSDDHEALALARRMAEHPNVRLTVIWLKLVDSDYQPQLQDTQDDIRVMSDFHIKSHRHERIRVRETLVADGIGTTKVVLSMQHADLFIVGRHHEPGCPATLGLTDWSQTSSEIGAMGDMLATSDFQFSILVVQQQPRVDWDINWSRRTKDDDTLSLNIDYSPKKH